MGGGVFVCAAKSLYEDAAPLGTRVCTTPWLSISNWTGKCPGVLDLSGVKNDTSPLAKGTEIFFNEAQ